MQEITIPKIKEKKIIITSTAILKKKKKNSSNGFLKDRLDAKNTNFLKVLILQVKLNI